MAIKPVWQARKSLSHSQERAMSKKLEVPDHVGNRMQTYGDPKTTFPAMEDILCTLHAMRCERGREQINGEEVVLTQLVQKLIRREYSPENPDHYDDIIGYAKILKSLCVEE